MTASTLSVIVPCYNREGTIGRCLNSVFAQTRLPEEVIVVDDGSTDRSVEIVLADFPSVKIIEKPNGGVSSARNAGIVAASSALLATLDSDDVWLPEKLESQLALLETEEVDFLFSDFIHRDRAGNPAGWTGGLRQQLTEDFSLQLRPIIENGYRVEGAVAEVLLSETSFMHTSTMMFRARCFEGFRFDESLHGFEDLKMWVQLSRKFRVGYVDEILVNVEQAADSLGHAYHKMTEAGWQMYGSLVECLDEVSQRERQIIEARLAEYQQALAASSFYEGAFRESRRHYRDLFWIHPNIANATGWAKASLPVPLLHALRCMKSAIRKEN